MTTVRRFFHDTRHEARRNGSRDIKRVFNNLLCGRGSPNNYRKMASSVSCGKRVFGKDDKKFLKYVESTTTHGVSHVFIGKSKIRRVFWLIILLGAAGGCFYNIVNRIMYLASGPTSTTISTTREETLHFPEVTFCNLNSVRRSYAEEINLTDFFRSLAIIDPADPSFNRSSCNQDIPMDVPVDFRTVMVEGRHLADEFIVLCRYGGRQCTDDQFSSVITDLGVCYTFNSGEDGRILRATGTGVRHGLQLWLDIQQSEYISSLSLDAGVKIAIHSQGEPGKPDENGIAVPPGRNAFISLHQKVIADESSRGTCRDTDDFNFLHSFYNYSVAACLSDCLLTTIAERCQCIESSAPRESVSSSYAALSDCGISDVCCVIEQYFTADGCTANCPPACNYTTYKTSVSYSTFPARYQLEAIHNVSGTDSDELQENLLSINIYFEDLNVEREITQNAYSVVALLSDIGGQMGLFLGASIISILEFVVWLLDEIKDRCFGMSDRKIYRWMRPVMKETEKELQMAVRPDMDPEPSKLKNVELWAGNKTSI